MMRTVATYYDGLKPEPRRAEVELTQLGLTLSIDGGPIFKWELESVRMPQDSAPPVLFHRERSGARTGEVLEVSDAAFAEAMKTACPALGGTARERARTLRKVIGWSAAAIVSLAVLVVYGLPYLADRLTPLVPWSLEARLGGAVEDQIVQSLAGDKPRVCQADGKGEGAASLRKLMEKLSTHATWPGELTVKVVDSPIQNAFALPGGRIVLLSAFIEKAESADEVAAVLAHELGHVAHRDSMRAMIHAGGVSFLVGTLLGDFTGAGALVIASRTLLTSRYSRDAERQADRFGVELITKAGGDPRALGRFLRRVASFPGERSLEILMSHPVTEDRVAEIEKLSPPGTARSLLSDTEWRALRAICR
ncbi:MAG: M48 family metallopeptidase [Beijerinckiaceae bacterium]